MASCGLQAVADEACFPSSVEESEIRQHAILASPGTPSGCGPDIIAGSKQMLDLLELVDKVAALGVDAYLTGDAQESTAYVAREEKLNYIHAGHYNTEKVGIAELGRRIANAFQVEVGFCEIVNPL